MAVAIDTSHLAFDFIPRVQRALDHKVGEGRCRFQVHRVSVYATILPRHSEIAQQLYLMGETPTLSGLAKQEAVDWQADPDDDLGDAEALHHLHQQAATVPLLSSIISQSDRGNASTILTGSALSASINARTQGRLLSSFNRHSCRLSCLELPVPINRIVGVGQRPATNAFFPDGVLGDEILDSLYMIYDTSPVIVWAGPQRNDDLVFSQVQVDVVDLFSRRLPTSRPRKRQRTPFNQFLQISHSPGVEDTNRGNPFSLAKRFNGVRHRTDRNRNIWVAEMKPTKHKTKQDFGNFKSEDEAARAVDAAFHHYGRPDLLNFPHTSLQFLSTRPAAPAGLDEKDKVKFVKEEAKLLLEATAASSTLHSTHTNSLQIQELSAPPRRSPSDPFRSLSKISSPFRCRSLDEVDAVVSHPQPWMLHDSICDISTTGVLPHWETLNSMQSAEQGWDWVEDYCPLAAPLNPSASESPSMWLDSLIRSPPAPTYPRSPSPSPFQDEIAYALLEHQSI